MLLHLSGKLSCFCNGSFPCPVKDGIDSMQGALVPYNVALAPIMRASLVLVAFWAMNVSVTICGS